MRQTRTEVVRFRLSPAELDAMLTLAAIEKRTPSETMREALRLQAERRGVWFDTIGKNHVFEEGVTA